MSSYNSYPFIFINDPVWWQDSDYPDVIFSLDAVEGGPSDSDEPPNNPVGSITFLAASGKFAVRLYEEDNYEYFFTRDEAVAHAEKRIRADTNA